MPPVSETSGDAPHGTEPVPAPPPSWTRAVWPMALAPPALALALLLPAPLAPELPLWSAPPAVLVLFLIAAAAPAVTVLTARRAMKERRERNRALATTGALALGACAATAALSFVLAGPLLVRGGGAWILLAACATAVPVLAAFALLQPLSLFRWGLLAGECAVALIAAFVLREPRAADEVLRHAMLVAPGWGPASLGTLAPRRVLPVRADHDRRYEARLRAIERRLAVMIEDGAFAPPYVAWGDDARLVRAWVASRAAASPEMPANDAGAFLRLAISDRLAFAASPEARLEPFTRGGVLALHALIETEGLGEDEALRQRVHAAWIGVVHLATAVDDPALEKEAIAVLRRLFAEGTLDRTHPIHLATYSLERRRLVEAGDADRLIAFFDALGEQDFPEDLKKQFEREAGFVREHGDHEHAPVMRLLQARALANGGDGDLAAARAAYGSLLEEWPDASVAPLARAELLQLPRPPDAPPAPPPAAPLR